MNGAPARGRVGTVVAVGLLVLDGVLLLFAGLWGRQTGPALGGAACLLVALVVLFLWRRHRCTVRELGEARRAVRDEVEALRNLLRR